MGQVWVLTTGVGHKHDNGEIEPFEDKTAETLCCSEQCGHLVAPALLGLIGEGFFWSEWPSEVEEYKDDESAYNYAGLGPMPEDIFTAEELKALCPGCGRTLRHVLLFGYHAVERTCF